MGWTQVTGYKLQWTAVKKKGPAKIFWSSPEDPIRDHANTPTFFHTHKIINTRPKRRGERPNQHVHLDWDNAIGPTQKKTWSIFLSPTLFKHTHKTREKTQHIQGENKKKDFLIEELTGDGWSPGNIGYGYSRKSNNKSQHTPPQKKNNNKKRDPRYFSLYIHWEHLQSNLEGGGKKKRFGCFFPLHFSFTSLAIYFSVIAVHRGRHVESKKKKERLFLYLCALLA